ncbi:uncharacterized protein NPIL_659601 [Nephila pilipes]|uniref:Uncharacterized protein n=1 Tax=Nephila pilipes TaxID=299642 RepID=A0A8X6P3K9_NEPPI|nr:uncharacterized protein NPIL_659601 [Nephila pilipes]
MRQSNWAVWAHVACADDEPKHRFCHNGSDSWCKYNVSEFNNKTQKFKHKDTLSRLISQSIKPVCKDLSHLKLLRRCLVGKPQNANESLNSLIWKYSPKVIVSGLTVKNSPIYIRMCMQ